ncbi:MAG: DUF981 family protein [Actinomycetaceae bacterium]|nr:DUF981 family protein [Actinomycetaceae bacterium]
MIVYNEIVAVTTGAALIGFTWLVSQVLRKQKIESEGWAAFFGVTGLLLFTTGMHTTLTWPYGAGGFQYTNIAFGQPSAMFGAMLFFAAIYLWRNRAVFDGSSEAEIEDASARIMRAIKPISLYIATAGLAMLVLAFTFVRFQLGAAPPEEPISGNFGHIPILEALFLGGLWGIVGLGSILFAIAAIADRPKLFRWALYAIALGGLGFLLFGAMNFYTHIGMYYNIEHGTNHKW